MHMMTKENTTQVTQPIAISGAANIRQVFIIMIILYHDHVMQD